MHTEPYGLDVLHADDALLVLDKPAGLLSVPGRGPDKQDCLSTRAQRCYPDALVVHRLDMATSGLLLMARGKQVQHTLGQAFENRRIGKRYLACVRGNLAPAPSGWGTIDLPIAVDWPHRPRRTIQPHGGKPSTTRWRVIPTAETGCTRLELEPLTGRSHQLRVHLQAIGHPIVGDALYGRPEDNEGTCRLMLHAAELAFAHPVSGQAMHFRSEPDF